MNAFSGRNVLITGGASGIGAATTRAFAREGANVAFTYITSATEAGAIEAEIRNNGAKAKAYRIDCMDRAAVESCFEAAERDIGPIDVLFANAGGILKREKTIDMSDSLWGECFAVNVDTTFHACQAALKRMIPRKSGAIVTMASMAAYSGGGSGASHYAATKGAIVTYTRALAKEVGPDGIRVNSVAPGLIATRFHDQFNTPEGRKAAVSATPLGREGRAEDVAELVLFLASDKASFITGEIVQINGGAGLY